MLKFGSDLKTASLGQLAESMRSPLFRNGYALILNSAATSGLGILYWMLAARLYPAEVVGLNSAIISAMALLSTVSRVNLSDALLRFLPRAGHTATRLVIGSYVASLILALVVGMGLFAWLGLVPGALTFLRGGDLFAAVFIGATLCWSVFGLQDYVLTGARQALWVPIENGAFAALKIVLLVWFATSFRDYGIFTSWTIPVALSLLPVNWLIFRRVLPAFVQATERTAQPLSPQQIAKFALGNYAGALFWMAATMLLPLIVTQMLGAKANAYFYQPWLIASSLQLVASNMGMSLTVEGSHDQSRLHNYSRRVLIHTSKLLVPLVGATMLAAPFVMAIFGADYAAQGSVLLQLLALAAFPYLVMSLYLSRARVERNLAGLVGVQALFCVLALGLTVVLLPVQGITGVGWAWLAAQSAVALLLLAREFGPALRRNTVEIGRSSPN